jgi:hypothetical protein
VQGFGDVRLSAFRCDRERTQAYASGAFGKLLKALECGFDPKTGLVFRISGIPPAMMTTGCQVARGERVPESNVVMFW